MNHIFCRQSTTAILARSVMISAVRGVVATATLNMTASHLTIDEPPTWSTFTSMKNETFATPSHARTTHRLDVQDQQHLTASLHTGFCSPTSTSFSLPTQIDSTIFLRQAAFPSSQTLTSPDQLS
jgi:hypothetical protein